MNGMIQQHFKKSIQEAFGELKDVDVEARSGAFVYRDTLFAEVAEGKRHPRASVPDLKDLLLPKKGNVPKDQVAHWYEAQLLHYGLSRTKDKNTAKVRLLGGLQSGNLNVPPHVRDIETQLRKEYGAAIRKSKQVQTPSSQSKQQPSKKRKADDPQGSVTKMSFSDGKSTFTFEHRQDQSKMSPLEATSKDVTPSKRSKPATKPATSTSPTKKHSGGPSRSPAKPQPSKSPAKVTPIRPKQTARRTVAKGPDPKPTRPYRGSDSVNDEEEPPPPYSEYTDDHDPDISSTPPGIQISGVYTISTSSLGADSELRLRLSNPRSQLWGRFEIDSKIGMIRLDGTDDIASGNRVSFGWRFEDSESVRFRFKFGKGCDGWMQFDGDGGVTGIFYEFDHGQDVEFDGQLQEDFSYEDDEEREDMIGEIETDWQDLAHRAYGRK